MVEDPSWDADEKERERSRKLGERPEFIPFGTGPLPVHVEPVESTDIDRMSWEHVIRDLSSCGLADWKWNYFLPGSAGVEGACDPTTRGWSQWH